METPHLVHPGDVFGSLVVIEFSHLDKRWRRHYRVRCRCGTEKTVQGTLLRTGNTRSCGCAVREAARRRVIGHGVAARNQVIAGYRHKAKISERVFDLTVPQFEAVAARPCFYCGAIRSNVAHSPHGTGDYTYNGLDRIDSQKGYTINNVVACCRGCNLAKSARGQGEFIEWVKRCHDYLLRTAMARQWADVTG